MAGSYNPMNQQSQNSQYISSAVDNKGLFNKLLRSLSNFGMKYDDMIMRNTIGVNINEDPYSQKDGSMYSFFSQRAVASVLNRKSVPYLDRSYADKRRILREYSIKDEIRDFVATVSDEAIIYNDDKDFCSPKPLSDDYSQDIKDKYQEYFETIYNRFGFSDGITAWNLMRDFLIDGYVALELVWDDKKKNIIHFNRLRPETIVPAYEPSIGNLWIQFPEDPQLRRIFLDSQIILVSYSTQNDFSETSYLEGLIKPYNQVKILEQTRIMFNIINASIHQKFTIPINGIPRQRAEEQIGQLIADYSEEVEWDDSLGTVSINGRKHLPYNKQYWFPSSEAGTPSMELDAPQGHNLNEDVMLKWFMDILRRASKIPFQRFMTDNGGGNMFTDASEMTRDEVKYNNFIGRLRANFKELLVKPLKLQMCMEFPELKDDEIFLNQVDVVFNTNELFEEWKKLGNMEKRANILTTMLGIQTGEGQPYFHIDYLVDKVLKLTPEEKEENKAYWIKYGKSGGGSAEGGGEAGGEAGGEMGASEMGGAQAGGQAVPEGGGGAQAGGQAVPEAPAAPEGGGGEFEF
jgi:Bacteriophage T4-like portal protein (Gp20)